jgi:ABC-type Mn2+/Zn2+ transport system permease subunit
VFDWLEHEFMVQALLACSAMGALLAYLGIHVVGRGIVFVDLALGQISSMGVAFAHWRGYDPVVCSMAATLAGAALCAGLRVRDPRLRLEAVIGIFYAVSSAITVVLIARTPHGEADISDVLFGNVLALDAGEVRAMLAVFAGVAVAHALLGRRFFELTYRKGAGEAMSARDHFWNLVFYVLLAFAIVFAIRAGGVIPVFAFLIVPPVAALRVARRTGAVIAVALGLALAGSLFGLDRSYDLDLPAGASIVAVLGGLGLLVALGGLLVRRRPAAAALCALALLLPALAAAQEGPAAPPAPGAAAIAAEVEALKRALSDAQARIAALEARLAALAAPAPPAPAAPALPVAAPAPAPPAAAGGLKLLDLSLSGLFSAGASEARAEDLRQLEFGGHDPKSRGFTVQNLEMTLSGVVDPYLRADAHLVFQIDEEGESIVEVEEAYLTTLALPAGLQVKAGTFFSPFGRLNAQHPHAWTFADQPVVNGRFLGPDGLRGPGAQLAWLLPTPFYAEATFALQNSHGETAFSFRNAPGEELFGRTIVEREVRSPRDLLKLGRLATSFDPTPELTIVPAVSWVEGPNGTGAGAETSLLGLDFYGRWRPLANDHGWPFVSLQLEWMERDYEAAAQRLDDGTPLAAATLGDRGAYAQALWGFRRRWVAGVRYDRADGGDPADPLRDRRERWSTNVTFYPSEFSKLRLQYNFDSREFLDEEFSSLFLQFEYLYGAHGGHKF